jgi:5-hydroxyisourate hydrolase
MTMAKNAAITTHVLDTCQGRPAGGLAVELTFESAEGGLQSLGGGTTDSDGRVRDLLPSSSALAPGTYRLTFSTGAYFHAQGIEAFYPEVVVAFRVSAPAEHHHVPLLLGRYGYSTYRGS